MTLHELNTEKDIETAFQSAVRCFQPPAGLKEAVAERLSKLRASETRGDAVQTTGMDRHRSRAFPKLLKWATCCAAACLLIGAAIVIFLRSGMVSPKPKDDLAQTPSGPSGEEGAERVEGGADLTSYRDVVKAFGPDDVPQMIAQLNDVQYRREWRFIARRIGFVAERGDRDAIEALRGYLERKDIWDEVKGDRTQSFDVGMGKILCLEWIGMIGGPEAEKILLKALTEDGAQELTREWIELAAISYPGGRAHVLESIRGRAAIGLIYCQSKTGIALVEAMYEKEKARCVEAGIQTSHYFNELVSAMAYKACIDEYGVEKAYELCNSEESLEILAPYLRIYWLGPQPGDDPAQTSQDTPGITSAIPSPKHLVGRASLIVRARVAGWEEGIIRHDVERVLYGDFEGRTLDVDYSGVIEAVGRVLRTQAAKDLGHEPTPTELEEYVLKHSGIEKGREEILYLIPLPAQPGQPSMYFPIGGSWDVPPKHRLDDVEDAIIRSIAEGSYLSPPYPEPDYGYLLEQHIRAADLIVRAQLVEVNEIDSRWIVTELIRGDAQEKTLILPHDLFRLRAEAVVRHKHRAEQPGAEPTLKQEIAAEMKRLIEAELVLGRHAVLFVSDPTVEGEAMRAHLRQRTYEDASGKRLDEAIRVIRNVKGHKLPVIW